MEAIEDYDSRPHKLVRFEIIYETVPQAVRIPKPLPGCQWRKSTNSGRQYAWSSTCDEHKRDAKQGERGTLQLGKRIENSQGRDPSTHETHSQEGPKYP